MQEERQPMKRGKRDIKGELLIAALVFMSGFLVSCLIHYSDGDDAIFLGEIAARPRFFDFFTYLTKTMNGRLSATASLWVVFHFSIWVWRILNGLAITVFTMLFSRIIFLFWYGTSEEEDAMSGDMTFFRILGCTWFSLSSFLIVGTGVIGYSCLWISGSVNYLWPFTAALMFMYPVLLSVYQGRRIHPVPRCLSLFCGVYAALCQEQVALCLLAFLFLAALKNYREKGISWLIIGLLLILTAAAILILAPFTEKREAKELQWLPGYESLNLTGKLFLMVQFVAHSFTHGLRFAMVLLWGILGRKMVLEKKRMHAVILTMLAGLACVTSFAGKALTNVGLDGLDMNGLIDPVPCFSALSGMQKGVLFFWLSALAYTLILLVVSAAAVRKENITQGSEASAGVKAGATEPGGVRRVFLYLAALASAAVMVESPSIYASGERTLFVSGMMLMLLSADCVYGGKHPESAGVPEGERRGMLLLAVICLLVSLLQLLSSVPLIREMLT